MKLLFKTVRIQRYFADPSCTPEFQSGEKCHTYSIWHDSLLMVIFAVRKPKMAALAGAHRDGSYVSNVLKLMKIECVRGSSSRGGSKAAVELLEFSKGYDLALTPDGPRGPKRKMKPGCAFIAGHAQKPVVAIGLACTNAWHIRGSWTTLIIPKPFSKIYAIAGNPIAVPENPTREQIDIKTEEIQAEMDLVNDLVERLACGEDLPVQEMLARSQVREAA